MKTKRGSLLAKLPRSRPYESFKQLLRGKTFRVERIVSFGQVTAPGEWYDQDEHEWVLLLTGSAGLQFENRKTVMKLKPGDFVHIPAHRRHRVEWTDRRKRTIWLAIHYRPSLVSG